MGAAALPIIALGAAVGGQLYQGYSENKAQRRAARMDEENGRLALKDGEQQVADILRTARYQQGETAASIGQGLLFGGSVSDVLRESSMQAELDIERVREAARGEARNQYAQAAERRRAGKNALIGSVFSAVSTAVSGASSISQQRAVVTQAGKERASRLGKMG